MINDAIVVGGGPAGAVAATILARAGARVRLVDRATFPRDKLCGDTINPGTLAVLRRLNLAGPIETRGLPIEGMLVTGAGGVAVEAPYPPGLLGKALVRRELDWALVQQAVAAGASLDTATIVRRVLVDEAHKPTVNGVILRTNGAERAVRSRLVIAADGRRSTVAFGLRFARHPGWPRRWAVGAYFEGVRGLSTFGEMHVRNDHYVGVAPLPGGLANVCLVKPSNPGDDTLRDPEAALRRELARDRVLRDRFDGARLAAPPVVLGPLAVDVNDGAFDGLLLAGDAAGFIDPMTGDGLRVAVSGGELAARAALHALEHGWAGVHDRLALDRRREFGAKWRLNRALRALVASAAALKAGTLLASVAPSLLRAVARRAGDCAIAS